MEKNVMVLFLLSTWIVNTSSLMQVMEPGKNICAEKTLIATKTKCRSCSLNFEIQCPEGYTKVTNNSGIRDCRYYLEIRTFTLSLSGCRHVCTREYLQPQCCPGYWGPNCLAKSQHLNLSSNFNLGPEFKCQYNVLVELHPPAIREGIVFRVILGMEPVLARLAEYMIDHGQEGLICQTTSGYDRYDRIRLIMSSLTTICSWDTVCSCIHGVCNSGITGDGKCTCLSGYKGSNCDQAIPDCEALQCPENSRCSVSSKDQTQLECKCLPNYQGDGKQCEPINPCSKEVCDPHADCFYLGPNRHRCTCQYGYKGDGQVCIPIDPCQTKFGNCPPESSVCKYDGPGKSHCECKEHFRKFVPGLGCSMTDLCATNNPCHKYAECTMAAPGQTLCTCQTGYVGDGFICYGNIMDQIRDMNTEPGGQWQGKLTSAIEVFESTYEWQLNSLGPFTVLVPTNKGFKGISIKDLLSNKESAQYFVKLHIIAGQLDLNRLNNTGTVYTVTGKPGDILNGEKDVRIRIQGGKKKGKILQGDIVASNGIVHIIDKALDNMEPNFESYKEISIMAMLQDKARYSTFRSILESDVMGSILDMHHGPNTIFIPTNGALENLKAGALDYLLSSKGSRKLHELVHYHIVPHTQGQILVNGEQMEEIDIVVKNGRVYTLSGVLIPPSIIPILPQRCDEEKNEIKMGTCGKCPVFHKNSCPEDSQALPIIRNRCIYRDQALLRYGCAKYCNVTKKEPNCCKGFFGPDCSQCPGGFSNPCSGNGQCVDGMKGNGTCVCNTRFEGSHCQFCSDPNKYGPQCEKKCLCIYGKCDNQIDSDGICLPGSCKSGYAGKFCDTQVFPCGMFLQFCHAHADCLFKDGALSCVCKPGYEGDGITCSEVDPCANLIPHGCDTNAECIKTGPGAHECVCQPGWTGNGRDCSEINNCLLPHFGGCHSNASCLYIGPGQNDCECKEGFRGNGYECEPLNSCSKQNGKCHPLAVCQFTSSGLWECVCSKGYEGDGSICYGNAMEELSSLSEAAGFNEWIDNLTIDGANIVAGDIAATNGIIHVIDKVLTPLRGVSGALPKLLARLEQMPDYSIFRGYIIQYNLANEIEAASTYTIFAPNNEAIESYLKNQQATSLDEEQIRYHIILEEKLFKNDMHNGMFRETMLGLSFRLGFSIHDAQLYINEAPLNYANVATDKGIIHGLGKVMEIQKNRCDIKNTMIVTGTCLSCSLPPGCPPDTTPVPGKSEMCFYVHQYRMNLRSGCQPKCTKNFVTRECCAGFYGPQCEPCPGLAGNVCFGNGICLDGVNGTGSCECEAGFKGLACDRCIEGKYGSNCDQECACIHGECSSGIKGDGSCKCDVGWRGVKCESAAFSISMAQHIASVQPGFKGMGHTVQATINACEASNGGCSAKAECRRTTPGNRVCVCKAGYTGDGIVCLEINPCLTNNGGCDKKAECSHVGPNQNNGGCGKYAFCNDTEQTERTCTCKSNYIGDGFTCRGHILQELSRDLNTTGFSTYLADHGVRDMTDPGPFTVFVPTTEALRKEVQLAWITKGMMPQILRYHMVSCTGLLSSDLTSDKTVTTVQGDQIKITFSQDSVFLNGQAKVITSDIICTNGVIHIIDKVLVPQKTQEFLPGQSKTVRENLKIVAAKNGYIMFANLLESSGLMSLINNPLHQPVTLFWPSDKVIRALPKDQQDTLFKMSDKEKLQQYLKFHIIGSAEILAYALPTSNSMKTLQGSDLTVTCGDDDTNIGELFLNERRCKIVQRQLEFNAGIAYGIDCMLTDPTLGGRCDTFITSDFPGEKKSCTYAVSHRILKGCRQDCSMMVRIPQCCKGYFGNDCQACPGGPEAPCNNRGSCEEGYAGTGQCVCNGGFNGTACELCLPGRYGLDCKCRFPAAVDQLRHGHTFPVSAQHMDSAMKEFLDRDCVSVKLDGLAGSVKPNSIPPLCVHPAVPLMQYAKRRIPANVSHITMETESHAQVKLLTAIGKTNYQLTEDLCKKNNGGCHKNARCTQSGVQVNCTCQKGYSGDGHTCIAINPCTDGFNGGCHEHAICTKTGPNKRKCDCSDNYIGDGINCEVKQLPVDRCLQDNGECHADADCADLHFQDSTVGVFHIRSPKGQYKLTFNNANKTCADEGATIATYNQLSYAQKAKFHLCAAGWLADGRVAYPTAFSAPKCGGGLVGIIDYGIRVNLSETWDVFCYRIKDVNCTCKIGYVGDGFTCSGNLLQVLLSFPTLTNFVSEVLTYSNTSRKGQEFLKYLTNLSIRATLFVPNNDGLKENEAEKRYVDGKAILGWDIIASNGVIHVIMAPLKAPPLPPASLHPGAGTGIFFAVLLVIGIIALVGYSYFRFKQGNIRFQHFKQKDDIDVTTLDKTQPANFSNPNYDVSTTSPPDPSYDPFSDSDEQQLVTDGTHDG
ncbi:hypothetical protein lerEdw1_019608 [Lerista edwardsae]|nr:hypothetical protein lerEdw1_019608 [Lerista edwardsae]